MARSFMFATRVSADEGLGRQRCFERWFPDLPRLSLLLLIAIGLDYFRWVGIILIVTYGQGLPSESQSTLHGFEQFANDTAVGWDLNLDATILVEIDDGERLACAVEDILGDVGCAGVAFGAETAALFVHVVRVGACQAVGGVAGEGSHDVEFIVVGEAGVGCRYGSETDLAGSCGRHG